MVPLGGVVKRRAHSLGALTSVHEATAPEGRSGRVALKLFHPPASTNVRRVLALEAWLLSYERQRAAGPAALEPVAWGRDEAGAFVVLPWRESSLEPLIEAVRPTGDRLRAIAQLVLRALAVWETGFGGPHGNLKPSNIFLDGTGPLATRTAVLSDPWSGFSARTEDLRQRDLQAVAAILVRVVRGRAAGGWPIDDAPEWHRLGRAGGAWREYCNYLLDPAPDEKRTVAEALRRLERIPHDARPGRTAGLAAAGLVVASASALFGFARFGSPDHMPGNVLTLAEWVGNPRAFRTEVSPEWALLCRAWSSWTADVLRNAERWQRTEELWLERDPLRPALGSFRTEAPALDPRVLVPESAGFSLGLLADAPPEDVQQQLLRASVDRRIKEAWSRIEEFAQNVEQWPRWAEIALAAEQLRARDYPRITAELTQRSPYLASAEPPSAALVVRAFNDLSQDRDGVLALLPRWQAVEAVAAELATSGDRVQAAMPRLVLESVPDRSSIGDFADSLAPAIAELRQRRAEFMAPDLVRERFLREAPIQTATGEVTRADLNVWSAQLRDYTRVARAEDPREQENWDERLVRLANAGSDLEAEAPPAEGGGRTVNRADFDRELAQLRARLAELRQRVVVRRDVPAVTQAVETFAGQVVQTERVVDATLALLRPELWLNRIARETFLYPASQARWQAWRDRHLATVTAENLEGDRPRFRRLRDDARALEQWLDDLEGPPGFGGLDVPALAERSPATREAFAQWIQERTAQAVATVIERLEWPEARPREPWAQSHRRPVVRDTIETHGQWLNQLPPLAADLDQLGLLLQSGTAWDEGVAVVYRRLEQASELSALRGSPRRWLDETRRLATVATAVDRATLVEAAQGEGLSLRLTAWRRLGRLEDWPANAADLDVDGALVASLRTSIQEVVTQPTRQEELRAELASETRRRWNRAARQTAHREEELAAVFERMDRFGIEPAHLEPAVAYNLRLWQFKQADANEADLVRLRARRDEFVQGVQAVPEIASQPTVQAFLTSLTALALQDDPSRPAARSPRVAGWTEQLAEGGQRIVVKWQNGPRQAELEYQLVQPTDGTPPFYLSRRQISVGDFIELLSAHAEHPALLEALPAWARRAGDGSEPWTAPMAWRPRADRRGIELNSTWLYRPDAQVAPLLSNQPAEAPIVEVLRRERPTPHSPLQRISPDAARLFAERVLGARLPTPAEWRAILASGANGDDAHWRDRQFADLWAFVENHRVANQTISWRPNQGIYLPLQQVQDGARVRRVPLSDEGRAHNRGRHEYLWLAPVDQGPETNGFIHLLGNVWIYLYDPADRNYYVAGGSILSPPEVDPLQIHRVEGVPMIGQRAGQSLTDGFSDVGLRPAFDAPPGLRDRLEMLRLVRVQQFLTL